MQFSRIKLTLLALLVFVTSTLPIVAWNSSNEDVEFCVAPRVDAEYLLRPELRKLCRCFVDQLDKRMSDREKKISLRMMINPTQEYADRLLREFSREERIRIGQRAKAVKADVEVKCAPLMSRKMAS